MDQSISNATYFFYPYFFLRSFDATAFRTMNESGKKVCLSSFGVSSKQYASESDYLIWVHTACRLLASDHILLCKRKHIRSHQLTTFSAAFRVQWKVFKQVKLNTTQPYGRTAILLCYVEQQTGTQSN